MRTNIPKYFIIIPGEMWDSSVFLERVEPVKWTRFRSFGRQFNEADAKTTLAQIKQIQPTAAIASAKDLSIII